MSRSSSFLILLLALVLLAGSACVRRTDARRVLISNVEPRRDHRTGAILPISDGNIMFSRGVYYLYGVSYQPCPPSEQPTCYADCGYYNMTISVASSPDMVKWTLESTNALPQMTENAASSPISSSRIAYFSPSVVEVADGFVMWLQFNFSGRASAFSRSPLGPFELTAVPTDALPFVSGAVPNGLPPNLQHGSSIYLWKDVRAASRILVVFNIIVRFNQTTPALYVAELGRGGRTIDPSSVRAIEWNCLPPAQSDPIGHNSKCFLEGGGIAQSPHNANEWLVVAGTGCCFCAGGADSRVFVSRDDARTWSQFEGYLNPPADPARSRYAPYAVAAQQFGIQQLPDPKRGDGAAIAFYTGMRWGSGVNKRVD
jgi:hypothetical protein